MHRPFPRSARGRLELARLLVPLWLLIAVPAPGFADWPHLYDLAPRGTSGRGGVFTSGPVALELAWSRPLGIGYSGISVAEGRAVTMYSAGSQDAVVALDATTGTTLWTHLIGPMFPSGGGSEGGPKSVPVIDAGIVYALGPRGDLMALRLADGSEVWRVRLVEELGAEAPEFGFATSPLVMGDLLFVQSGGASGHRVSGFAKATGAVVWSTGDDPPDYASPVAAELAGVFQILSVTHSVVSGIDPATGQILWSRDSEMSVLSSPVLLGDDRFLLPGDRGSAALRVRRTPNGLETARLWETRDLKGSYARPVMHDGFVYGYSGEFLTCVSASDGTRAWKSRQPGGRGLILVDGHLVIFGKGGKVVVAEASPAAYREVARIDVLDRVGYTYPSFADGRIFVRNTRGIAAVSIESLGRGREGAGWFHELARIVPLEFWGTVHGVEDWFFAKLNPRANPGGSSDRSQSGEGAGSGFHQETIDARGSRQFRTDGRTSYGLALMDVPAGALGRRSPESHVVVYFPSTITDLGTLTTVLGAPGPALPSSWVAFASTIDAFTSSPGPVLVSSGAAGGPFSWSGATLVGSSVGEVRPIGTPTPTPVAAGVHELDVGTFQFGGATYDKGVTDSGAITGATIVSTDFRA